jgi:hypothetical protein
MLAYDYPLLGIFWSMLVFFLFFAWLILLFQVFIDIFRSDDMGGFAKALWAIFVIIVPFFGVFMYVVIRGKSMTERRMNDAKASEAARQAYVREVAGSGGTADEVAKLAQLKDSGVLTEAEFQQQKAKLLS